MYCVVSLVQVTVVVAEVEATSVTEDTQSSSSTGRASTVVCEPPLETAPSLAPGESLQCTANTVVTQDDVNRGEVLKRRCMVVHWKAVDRSSLCTGLGRS